MARRRAGQDNNPAQQGVDTIGFDIAPKQATALRLRRLGYTYDQIAQKIGYKTASAARKLIKRAEREIVRDEARELVGWQLDRIDMALTRVMERIEQNGEYALFAVDRLAPLLKRQAELMGLDAEKDNLLASLPYTKRVVLEDAAATSEPADDEPAPLTALLAGDPEGEWPA